ncbi:hypothetical protein JQC92_02045 [Shewanella sp. 202IG2-18]|uniref:hypothetical protein n=1 Tax=Parashewanella hymeniacidonis TaxID=2807618 RepID=UPI001961DB3C|nr:hypothetical protein [Parashewanella hymeniacidonis]MBM7070822.1 hypothetical protein [Parashewanella hymeniacidonis]
MIVTLQSALKDGFFMSLEPADSKNNNIKCGAGGHRYVLTLNGKVGSRVAICYLNLSNDYRENIATYLKMNQQEQLALMAKVSTDAEMTQLELQEDFDEDLQESDSVHNSLDSYENGHRRGLPRNSSFKKSTTSLVENYLGNELEATRFDISLSTRKLNNSQAELNGRAERSLDRNCFSTSNLAEDGFEYVSLTELTAFDQSKAESRYSLAKRSNDNLPQDWSIREINRSQTTLFHRSNDGSQILIEGGAFAAEIHRESEGVIATVEGEKIAVSASVIVKAPSNELLQMNFELRFERVKMRCKQRVESYRELMPNDDNVTVNVPFSQCREMRIYSKRNNYELSQEQYSEVNRERYELATQFYQYIGRGDNYDRCIQKSLDCFLRTIFFVEQPVMKLALVKLLENLQDWYQLEVQCDEMYCRSVDDYIVESWIKINGVTLKLAIPITPKENLKVQAVLENVLEWADVIGEHGFDKLAPEEIDFDKATQKEIDAYHAKWGRLFLEYSNILSSLAMVLAKDENESGKEMLAEHCRIRFLWAFLSNTFSKTSIKFDFKAVKEGSKLTCVVKFAEKEETVVLSDCDESMCDLYCSILEDSHGIKVEGFDLTKYQTQNPKIDKVKTEESFQQIGSLDEVKAIAGVDAIALMKERVALDAKKMRAIEQAKIKERIAIMHSAQNPMPDFNPNEEQLKQMQSCIVGFLEMLESKATFIQSRKIVSRVGLNVLHRAKIAKEVGVEQLLIDFTSTVFCLYGNSTIRQKLNAAVTLLCIKDEINALNDLHSLSKGVKERLHRKVVNEGSPYTEEQLLDYLNDNKSRLMIKDESNFDDANESVEDAINDEVRSIRQRKKVNGEYCQIKAVVNWEQPKNYVQASNKRDATSITFILKMGDQVQTVTCMVPEYTRGDMTQLMIRGIFDVSPLCKEQRQKELFPKNRFPNGIAGLA